MLRSLRKRRELLRCRRGSCRCVRRWGRGGEEPPAGGSYARLHGSGKATVARRPSLPHPIPLSDSTLPQVVLTDPEPMLFHAEVVYRDGVAVGDVRAASYGHTLGGAVGLVMVHAPKAGGGVTAQWVSSGVWEVDIAGKRCPAVASLRPLYDPENKRIRG